MLGSIKKFLRNRRGAFAIQFALMVVPLTVCTGLAIDGGRAFLARFELESALDDAALAVGSTASTDNTALNALAKTYVDANFKTPHNGPIALTLTPTSDLVTLHGTVTLDNFFMPIVGQPTVKVSAESQVRRGGSNVEVSLALDITGSMAGSKIAALKSAAKDLVSQVVNDVQTPYFSKVAITPWGTNLHVSATYANALRGTPRSSTTISAAAWRTGSTATISSAGWRTAAGTKTVSAVAWKNGASKSVTAITKANPAVVTSSSHGLATNDYVYISGVGGMTQVNSKIFKVEVVNTNSYKLRDPTTSVYINSTAYTTLSSSGTAQKCYDASCNVAVTTSSSLGVAANGFVRITGVNGFTQVNNAADSSWVVASVLASPANSFTITGLNGPTIASTFSTSSSSGASECQLATCKFQITTSAAHGFVTNDNVFVWGATVPSSGGTSMISSTNSSWAITKLTNTQFTLPGSGYTYRDWTSGGSAAHCVLSTCNVQVTSTSNGLSAGEAIQVASVGGLTGINTSGTNVWTVGSVSGNNFTLGNTDPTMSNMSNAYTSGGTAQCVAYGCQKFRFTAKDNSVQILSASNCVTERYGAEAYTDAAPSTSYLGYDYPGAGSLVGCNTGNNITPMTSNKSTLNTAIDNLTVYGSTAGQIGAEWAWYMVSPNWGYLWPNAENKPKPYGTKELTKVAVLMTDGEFNTAHCNGVTSKTYAYSSVSDSDRNNCDPAETPFAQAQKVCTAMKAAKVVVYTVGFEVGSEPGAADFLTACATDPSHAYLADNATALTAAFKSIATNISKLRIAK